MMGITTAHRVSTGNQGGELPSRCEAICLPLNPGECGGFFASGTREAPPNRALLLTTA